MIAIGGKWTLFDLCEIIRIFIDNLRYCRVGLLSLPGHPGIVQVVVWYEHSGRRRVNGRLVRIVGIDWWCAIGRVGWIGRITDSQRLVSRIKESILLRGSVGQVRRIELRSNAIRGIVHWKRGIVIRGTVLEKSTIGWGRGIAIGRYAIDCMGRVVWLPHERVAGRYRRIDCGGTCILDRVAAIAAETRLLR